MGLAAILHPHRFIHHLPRHLPSIHSTSDLLSGAPAAVVLVGGGPSSRSPTALHPVRDGPPSRASARRRSSIESSVGHLLFYDQVLLIMEGEGFFTNLMNEGNNFFDWDSLSRLPVEADMSNQHDENGMSNQANENGMGSEHENDMGSEPVTQQYQDINPKHPLLYHKLTDA